MDQRICAASVRELYRIVAGKREAELDGEALDFPVDLHSNIHPWPWALGSEWVNEWAQS